MTLFGPLTAGHALPRNTRVKAVTTSRNPKTKLDVMPGARPTPSTTTMAPHNNIRAKISIHPIMKMSLLVYEYSTKWANNADVASARKSMAITAGLQHGTEP